MDSVAYHEANRRGGGPDGSENQRKSEKGGFSDAAVEGVFDVYIYIYIYMYVFAEWRGRSDEEEEGYIYHISEDSVLVSVRLI